MSDLEHIEQEARVALMEHYTSQMQGYKLYILTIFVAFFGGVQSLQVLRSAFPVAEGDLLTFLLVGTGLLLAFGTCFVARVFWYGRLARHSISAPKGRQAGQTMLHLLDRSIENEAFAAEDNRIIRQFVKWGSCGSQLTWLWVIIMLLAVLARVAVMMAWG